MFGRIQSSERLSRCARRALLALALAASIGCSEQRHPDVVVVVIDTLRSDRLSCYGYGRPTSPAIDQLAAEGTLFEDVTAQASWTLPSMASMLSGKYYTSHREYPDRRELLLAQAFKRAGYRTVGVVASSLVSAELGYDRGYDHYDAAPGDLIDGGPAREPCRPIQQIAEAMWAPLDKALERDASGERPPLFLYFHPLDPHFPYEAYPEHDDELPVEGAEPVQPPGWQAAQLAAHGPPAPPDNPGWQGDLDEFLRMRGCYDQAVRHVDDTLAKVFARLKELGVLDNAIVAIVSDHGEGLWEHMQLVSPERLKTLKADGFFFQGHGRDLYEEAIRTPFILWGAGVPKGMRSKAMVENVDLYPTLCALAKIEPPAGLHGRNLVELFDGDATGWRDRAYSFLVDRDCILEASTNLKLITPTELGCANKIPRELFDIVADPHERSNLASLRNADTARLCAELARFVASHPTLSTIGEARPNNVAGDLAKMGYVGVAPEGNSPPNPTPCCRD